MIPADHDMSRAQHVYEKSTGQYIWLCNCASQPATRTLRFAAANRHLFSLEQPQPKTQEGTP
jgi:hypothetical protein